MADRVLYKMTLTTSLTLSTTLKPLPSLHSSPSGYSLTIPGMPLPKDLWHLMFPLPGFLFPPRLPTWSPFQFFTQTTYSQLIFFTISVYSSALPLPLPTLFFSIPHLPSYIVYIFSVFVYCISVPSRILAPHRQEFLSGLATNVS